MPIKNLNGLCKYYGKKVLVGTKGVKKCWASCLDNCAGGWSNEHYFSKCLYEDNETIKIWGLDWTKDNVVEINASNAKSKILCKKHNEQLSLLDKSIKDIKKAFKAFYLLASKQLQLEEKSINKTFRVDGRLFERWLLKLTVNGLRLCSKKHDDYMPDWYVVDIIFGKRKFDYNKKVGLYFVNPVSYKNMVDVTETTEVIPMLIKHEGVQYLMGSLIRVFGMFFFVKLYPEVEGHIEYKYNGVDLDDESLFHLNEVALLMDDQINNSVKLKFSF